MINYLWLFLGGYAVMFCVFLFFYFRAVRKGKHRVEGQQVPRVYAYRGETVTCENNHPICEFAETVHYGDSQDLRHQLVNWRQPAPEIGALLPVLCTGCNAPFGQIGETGCEFHFASGWR